MQKVYTVHSCSRTKISTETEIDGERVNVVRQGLVIELVPKDGVSGTVKLVLTGAQATDEAEKVFSPGSEIDGRYTPVELPVETPKE